ncbi:MAG: response regulator [Thermomicrobiales bacterium]
MSHSPLPADRLEEPIILVVDDEPSLVDAITYSLRREGWQVITASDGLTAVEMQRANQPALVVLDVMLPGMDGLQVCRAIRQESSVPILFLSARGEDVDRILGLEIGGDDYLTKPFVMRELVARVRANLRRVSPARRADSAEERITTPAPMAESLPVLAFDAGRVTIDLGARKVLVEGRDVPLKNREFELLSYLARRPNIAVSREQLLREVWHHSVVIDTRTVDVHVRGLRQKLEIDPAKPALIETVRGHGYRLNAV